MGFNCLETRATFTIKFQEIPCPHFMMHIDRFHNDLKAKCILGLVISCLWNANKELGEEKRENARFRRNLFISPYLFILLFI